MGDSTGVGADAPAQGPGAEAGREVLQWIVDARRRFSLSLGLQGVRIETLLESAIQKRQKLLTGG